MRTSDNRHPRFAIKAFTLVELLVVIGIIAVLIGVLLPVLAKARASAKNTASAAALRDLQLAYSQYTLDHHGALLPGFLPDFVQGVAPTVSDPFTGQVFTGRAARIWTWRLAERQGNGLTAFFKMIRPNAKGNEFPQSSDDAATADSKAYTIALYPNYGLNTTFLGGHGISAGAVDYLQGFKADGTPNTGKHVAFRAAEIREPANQIVFTEVAIRNAMGSGIDLDDSAGLHYVTPPQADTGSGQYWNVQNGQVNITLPATPKRTLGIPYSRATGLKGAVPVSFFDGHVELLKPAELLDMRKWSPKATTPNWSF